MTLHMQVKSEFLQLLLKNKLTDFIASVSEAVRGIFLPPPKLRPQKNVTMFTNRKRVYRFCIGISQVVHLFRVFGFFELFVHHVTAP